MMFCHGPTSTYVLEVFHKRAKIMSRLDYGRRWCNLRCCNRLSWRENAFEHPSSVQGNATIGKLCVNQTLIIYAKKAWTYVSRWYGDFECVASSAPTDRMTSCTRPPHTTKRDSSSSPPSGSRSFLSPPLLVLSDLGSSYSTPGLA